MIELQKISKTYNTGVISFQALKSVDLKIEQGEFVAIMGASGSGKSTLLHILGFLDPPDEGSYFFLGQNVANLKESTLTRLRNKVAGFVFQQFHLLPGIKAHENVSLPLIYGDNKNIKEKALEQLKAVGLKDRTEHVPNELSGGERQRVAIARALVNDPLVIFADEPTGNLDTTSEKEIMKILVGLNSKGITIIMVTHEMEIAEHASRIISMRDGEIISDVVKSKNKHKLKMKQNTVAEEIISNKKKLSGNQMEWISHLKQAIRAINVNKLRSFLSMLGILIGVAAVIAMLALGKGATSNIEKDLSRLGSNLLIVMPGSRVAGGISMGAGISSRFSETDLTILKRIPTVKRASGIISGKAQVVYSNKNWRTSVSGTDVDYSKMREVIPNIGRYFTENEQQNRERVAVIGATIVENLYGTEDPLGQNIKINKVNFKVIGVLPKKGFSGGRDENDIIYIPLSTAMYRLMGERYLNQIQVEVDKKENINATKQSVTDALNKAHKWSANDNMVTIRDMAEIQDAIKGTITTISLLLGIVATIALLVGGIGIMNIMLVSVTERTREIGLRKAIGAGKKDIMNQFLVEAVIITVVGGIFGVLLGWLISVFISFFAKWTTEISLISVLVSTGFSIIIGLIFGLWPAKQAASLKTIDALRYE